MVRILISFLVFLSATLGSEILHQKDELRLKIGKNLNPGKGATLWLAPEKTTPLSWATYGDLTQKTSVAVTLPSELEITFSPFTSLEDGRRLMTALTLYDLSFSKLMEPTYLMSKEQSDRTYGTLLGHSFLANSDVVLSLLLENPDGETARQILHQLAQEGTNLGAHQMHLITEVLPDDHEYQGVQKILDVAMQKLGFRQYDFGLDLDTGLGEKRHTLKLPLRHQGRKDVKPLENLIPVFQSFTGYDLSYLSTHFNFIVRDAAGVCQGGLCADFEFQAALPHAAVSPFVMSEAVRHTRLGSRVMSLFEAYVKAQGIDRIYLDTCDFQAPGFYRKKGFLRIKRIPDILVGHDGRSYGMQSFVKNI